MERMPMSTKREANSLRRLGAAMDTTAEAAGSIISFAAAAKGGPLPIVPLFAWHMHHGQANPALPEGKSNLGQGLAEVVSDDSALRTRPRERRGGFVSHREDV